MYEQISFQKAALLSYNSLGYTMKSSPTQGCAQKGEFTNTRCKCVPSGARTCSGKPDTRNEGIAIIIEERNKDKFTQSEPGEFTGMLYKCAQAGIEPAVMTNHRHRG